MKLNAITWYDLPIASGDIVSVGESFGVGEGPTGYYACKVTWAGRAVTVSMKPYGVRKIRCGDKELAMQGDVGGFNWLKAGVYRLLLTDEVAIFQPLEIALSRCTLGPYVRLAGLTYEPLVLNDVTSDVTRIEIVDGVIKLYGGDPVKIQEAFWDAFDGIGVAVCDGYVRILARDLAKWTPK